MCHTPFLKKTTPTGKEIPLFVDKELFTKSVHGKLSCRECHKVIKLEPAMHTPSVYNPYSACLSCHKKDESRHAQEGISCNKCHYFAGAKSHQFAKEEKARELCLSCHDIDINNLGAHK